MARRDASGNLYYYAEDFIGSSRVITQSNGTLCSDADFLPFGQEVDFTSACGQNYKFEGKERDIETGNDNFGARYYRSALGRWMSPDWSAIPAPVPYANLTNPQTLNLYAMTSDNPETFADLDGHTGAIEAMNGSPEGFDMVGAAMTSSEEAFALLITVEDLIKSAPAQPAPQQPPSPPQSPTEAQNNSAAAPALKGPYVADLKSKEIAPLLDPNHKSSNSDVVGPNGECVDLTKKFSGMGDVSAKHQWYPGEKVSDAKDIKRGTAIASFDDKGRFPSESGWNSGIYLGRGVNGSIWILDQWRGHPPAPREVLLNNRALPANNSAAYSVILTGPWR